MRLLLITTLPFVLSGCLASLCPAKTDQLILKVPTELLERPTKLEEL